VLLFVRRVSGHGRANREIGLAGRARGAGRAPRRFLARRDPRLSRSRYKALIQAGQVSLSGQPLKDPNRKVAAGELIECVVPPAEDPTPAAENIPLSVVYEDEDLVVIDKPPGLVVHPGAGNPTGTLVNALLAHCGDSLSGIGGVRRPGIVHRLDKDTSGLLVGRQERRGAPGACRAVRRSWSGRAAGAGI
jgi:23S rRNA pseudouridine1911/1915/1917 synthase